MKNNKICKLIYLLLTIGLCAVWILFNEKHNDAPSLDQSYVSLLSCTDGDTANFLINGKEEAVRFLAIDTPETVKQGTQVQPYGKEASNFTCNALKNAEEIILEYEASTKEDKYDRKLAWILVDNQLLQANLIKEGLAKVAYVYGDYKYTEELQMLEKIAKENKTGIWSDGGV